MENLVEKLYKAYNGKRVLVTGHTGFKGSWLCQWLVKMNAEVYGISKDISSNPSMFEDNKIAEHLNEDIRLNVLEGDALLQKVNEIKPHYIFHLAAQPIVSLSYKDPVDTFMNNTIGYASLLNTVRLMNDDCTVVLASSDKCYKNKEWTWGYRENDEMGGYDPYSASKATSEIVGESFFHSFFKGQDKKMLSSVRAGNVIGGGDWSVDRIIPDAFKAWYKNEVLYLRRPGSVRPWQFVLEPLFGYLLTAIDLQEKKISNGECFNFGPDTTQNLTVGEMIEQLQNISKVGTYEAAPQNATFYETSLLRLNADKAKTFLKWKPVINIDETLTLIANWYKEYQSNKNMFVFTEKQIEFFEKAILA